MWPMIFLSLFVAFLYAVGTVIQKKLLVASLHPASVMVITGVFYAMGLVFIALYYRRQIGRDLRETPAATLRWIPVIAVAGGLVPGLLFLTLLRNNHSAVVSALTYSAPLFVLAITMALGMENRIEPCAVVGVVLVVLGIGLIAYASRSA